MAFEGWPAEAVEFYEGLEADNSKVYWQDHRTVYDTCVKALLAELVEEFGAAKLFRPHRDVRFSADKSPYKTNCAARIGDGYVSFSAEGLSVGSGLYMPDRAALTRYRDAVDAERTGTELTTIVAVLREAGYQVMAHEVLRTAPKGFPKDHPRIDLLRYKGIAMMKSWPVGSWLGTRKAKDQVVGTLRAAQPLSQWLASNVG